MNRQDNNIEELFRTLFDQFTVNPTPGLWKKVQGRIAWKQFLSFGLNSFNVYYLVLIVGLAGAGIYYGFSRSVRENITEEQITVPPAPPVQPEPVVVQAASSEGQIQASEDAPGSALPAGAAEAASASGTDIPNRPEASGDRTFSGNSGTKSEKISESPENQPFQTSSSEMASAPVREVRPARIEFNAVPLSGCSPLAVSFMNLSQNASGITWNFGDGGSSDESNPSYVFDEAGEFLITLKGRGNDGKEYSRQKTVRVYETPKAHFEFDEDVKPAPNRPIYFYNYSRGGEYYEWDFGDNQHSDLQEPIHFYQEAGIYHVKLKVWTEHQCYDSLVIFNAFTTQEQGIKVPNAFTPNLNGPTGGYYDVNDYSNTVFHPVTNGELAEYQLKVFNRKGLLLFESNDLSIGWDGYYNEQLMKQDVYIWKIRGKFINGKTFVESGDVTLIKQY